MKELLQEKLGQTMTYEKYRELIDKLIIEGKTTGPNQSEAMLGYTKLNAQRMNRLDKKMQLEEDLLKAIASIEGEFIWLVITEGWCGDAAQILPIFQKIAESTDKISLQLILRDDHPELIDKFLTGGARAIPKLISIDKKSWEVVATWGPRPEPAQKMLMEFKANPSLSYDEFSLSLQKWYNKDKGKTTQEELVQVLKAMNQLYI